MLSGATRQSGDEPAAGGEHFGVVTRQRGGTVVLSLSGELDHDTAEPLRRALAQQVRAGAKRILVDCGGLHFCDSTGLNVLLHARLDAQETDGRVDLAALRPPVARMFEITGAHAVFQVYAGVEEALADERSL
ncbi:STAS domain-containing protein [Streptomyces sp. NPDC048389]|uniref:STAS domain-containing protein n=1 Tax=Streptomyces sp. NPDC048389 TaxID=3154622 RepID=UPI00345697BA